PTTLDQASVLLIALLAAFLTVVQVWQIPEPENPLIGKGRPSTEPGETGSGQATANSAGGAQGSETKSGFDPSPFASKFGKTVITGLGGLAAQSVLKSLEGKPAADDKDFYIVWFILFFFVVLSIGAFWRGAGEALRERITISRPRLDFLPSERSWWMRI